MLVPRSGEVARSHLSDSYCHEVLVVGSNLIIPMCLEATAKLWKQSRSLKRVYVPHFAEKSPVPQRRWLPEHLDDLHGRAHLHQLS